MIFLEVSLGHYLVFSALMFLVALFGLLVVKNLIRVLLLLEIIFSSICLNFIAFANYFDTEIKGMLVALFVVGISVIQLAIGVALCFSLYKYKHTVNIDNIKELGG